MLYFSVHSLQRTLYTLAHSLLYLVVCLVMSCNSFPEYVRKRPRLHGYVLGFARRSPSENALGFSFGFTIIGETAVLSAVNDRRMKPPFDSRKLWIGSAVTIGGQAAESKPPN